MGETMPRFGSARGAELAEGTTRCARCDTHGESVAPSAADASPGEQVLAVVGGLALVTGFLGLKHTLYSLVITDSRVIFAHLTKERMAEIVGQARDAAKTQGKGFFGQWGAQLGASAGYHERYREMSPEAALAEEPGNFAINRADIRKVRFKRGAADEYTSSPDRVIIKTASQTYKLQVAGSLRAVKDAFRQAGLAS